MIRIAVLFFPSFCGLLWQNDSAISIAWSLAGSIFIAAIAQASWFREVTDDPPITHRLLRPTFMYHFYFIGFHVVGAGYRALHIADPSLAWQVAISSDDQLSLIAAAQGLMLLAHASATAGMKIAARPAIHPKYVIAYLPPYALVVVSFTCLGLGNILAMIPELWNISQKFVQLASTAILVEITFAIAQRNFHSFIVTLLVLSLNIISQILSAWKGAALWTMITLAALLYPLMPRRVLAGGFLFILLWAFYLHPFGTALRPLLWFQQLDRETAVAISLDTAMNMSFADRLDNVWTLMVGRASDMYQFERYLKYVPDNHPYFGLEIASQALVAMVPRVIWPEKPELEQLAMERVYAAGIVSEQSVVSAKANFYQDAYLSGGWPIVVLASFILGALAVWLCQACERCFGGYEIGTCLIFASLFGTSFNVAPDFIHFVGSVCTAIAVTSIIFFAGRALGWILPAYSDTPTATRSAVLTPTRLKSVDPMMKRI